MKNNCIVISLFIVFLFLVGCGKETINKIYVCSDGAEVTAAALCPTIVSEELEETSQGQISIEESAVKTTQEINQEDEKEDKDVNYILSPAERALLEERFTPAMRSVLSTPIVKELHSGDVYVAGLAIRNILGSYGHEFVVTIKFREAKDFSGSIIPTDDYLIQAWMSKNLFTTYILERGEELILPLIIDVGDTITEKGDPTLPGTYIYDVYVDYVTSTGSTDEYEKLLLTVQVVE